MGNVESCQFADALSQVCQRKSGDISVDRLLAPEFLEALEEFLKHIKSNWDKFPSSVADIVKDKLLPRFDPKEDPKGDPEAWVHQQIVREPADDFPNHLYDHLVSLRKSKITFEVAKRNVLLIAFSNLQIQRDSGPDRGALSKYLITVKEKNSEQEIRKIRNNCNDFTTAGRRLQSWLGNLGGSGALICGLYIAMSTEQSAEKLAELVVQNSLERCGRLVDALLKSYETEARVWVNSQTPPGRKRKREISAALPQSSPRTAIADYRQTTSPLMTADNTLQHVDNTLHLPIRGHSEVLDHSPRAFPAEASYPAAAQDTGDPCDSSAAPLELISTPVLEAGDEELVGNVSEVPSLEPVSVSNAIVLVEGNRSYRDAPVIIQQLQATCRIVSFREYSGTGQRFINGTIDGQEVECTSFQ
ncbi:hypothetical protein BDP55DRAFT_440040 [Colletotrichum godetiae]|uniref:Uncharacterized protein n=1 Tax=Colletotrichum godetiae TaxID=1209918 RepID=A0AAJ0EQD4_9PEZI|nr:uncharacterized protein BDP55DRAFT_440040 [Colletotrichum godetiae]KAK1657348.1 hypothetical protein BDP55DRAFT_440040 [Colletotrichum godetiae]